jgi:hypothetical protein
MLIERINIVVAAHPGLTAREVAEILFGINGYGERVRPDLIRLIESGCITRQGSGGPADPYTYHPVVA